MRLVDVVLPSELFDMVEQGYVKITNHPNLPLAIYNYTAKAQFDMVWNPVTCACRGLIINTDTQEVVARPYRKFFNYGDYGAPNIQLTDPVSAFDKLDGSLGIMYRFDDTTLIATRGSFMSDQAQMANKILAEKYPDFVPVEGYTMLFEIVYPENRIVVNYGDETDLYLLGAVDIYTGMVFHSEAAKHLGWEGPVSKPLAIQVPFQEVLNLPERDGKEGMVIYRNNAMMKIKQADYVELHRLVTGLNEKTVWQWLKDDKPLDDLIRELPEEFEPWINDTAVKLYKQAQAIHTAVDDEFLAIYNPIFDEKMARKDFAFKAMRSEYSGLLFMRYDLKNTWPKIWEMVKPKGDTGIFGRSEDVA